MIPRTCGMRWGTKVSGTSSGTRVRQPLADLRVVAVPADAVGRFVPPSSSVYRKSVPAPRPAPLTPDLASTITSPARMPARAKGASASSAAVG